MKKETKKEISVTCGLFSIFGILLSACSLFDMKPWEWIVGLAIFVVGIFGHMAFDTSCDEPWHVKIDK